MGKRGSQPRTCAYDTIAKADELAVEVMADVVLFLREKKYPKTKLDRLEELAIDFQDSRERIPDATEIQAMYRRRAYLKRKGLVEA